MVDLLRIQLKQAAYSWSRTIMGLLMKLSCLYWRSMLRLIVLLVVSCKAMCLVKLPPNISVPAIFAFGDSIMDTGNNNHLKTVVKCNFPPYGQDFEGGLPTGRFCNGKVPSDIIGTVYMIPSLYIHAFSFLSPIPCF